MKYLAIVQRTADGYRGYAPRVPGCQVLATTEAAAEAAIVATATLKAPLATAQENGLAEVIVAMGRAAEA